MSATLNSVEKVRRVQVFQPQDINGATLNEDAVSLKNYEHIEVVIQVGNIAGTSAVTLTQATDVAGTGEKSLGFDFVWIDGVKTAVVSDTFNLAATDDGKTFVIPIDASELDVANDFDVVRVDLTDPAAAAVVAAAYELSSARYDGVLTDPTVD